MKMLIQSTAKIGRRLQAPTHLFRPLLDLLRRLRTGQRRSELLTELRHHSSLFQAATYTMDDRYPALFAQCARLLKTVPAPRVLSYGCSTGEEAFSIHRRLPRAQVLGVDLNRWCLQEAARQNRSANIEFAHALSATFQQTEPFDAIFCMAVLQQTGNRNREAPVRESGFTFVRFEEQLALLDRKLLPGGLLFLDHCDFLFTDTALAAGYDPVLFTGSRKLRERPLFDRENRRVAEQYTVNRCFRKRVPAAAGPPDDAND